MFSLIITVVAIALVVALVATTMYHGGDTLSQGRITADAAAVIAGAQQIGGAALVYRSLESATAESVQVLLDAKYVASVPRAKGTPFVLELLGRGTKALPMVTSTLDSVEVCTQINKSAGLDMAAAANATTSTIAQLPYGCVSATHKFQFRYMSAP
jgi:hypothetical protein